MPAYYAHYRMGKLVLPELPAPIRQSISRFRPLFDMGLQGPDFFFFRNLAATAKGADLGHKAHCMTGEEFFSQACIQGTSEAARVYLYGLLGHYLLDSVCHPFVNQVAQSGKVSHSALESEFERYLLEMDGKRPAWCQDFASHIRLTRGECVTVAAFFPPATPGVVWQGVRGMSLSYRFLNQKNRPRAVKLLRWVNKSLLDHLIPQEPVEALAREDSELMARFTRCCKAYPRYLEQLLAHLEAGESLGQDFAFPFG